MLGNCTADQLLCIRYIYLTIPLLQTYKISSLQQYSLAVKPILCWTWLETIIGMLLIFKAVLCPKWFIANWIFDIINSHTPLHALYVKNGRVIK